MFLSNITQIQESVSITTSSKFEKLVPDLTRVQENTIKKYLGVNLYNFCVEKYEFVNEDLSQVDDPFIQEIIRISRVVMVGLGLFNYSSIHGVQINDAGYQMVSTDTHKQAFQWMKMEARAYLVQIGYTALDDLLAYIEANYASNWPDWQNEPARELGFKFLISSANVFNDFVNIGNSCLTYRALIPIMKKVEDFVIKNALGKEFWADIKSSQKDQQERYSVFIDDLKAAIACLTMERALNELSLQALPTGFLLNFQQLAGVSDASKTFSATDKIAKQELKETFNQDGNNYLKSIINYLNENASSVLFPLWYNSTKYQPIGTGSGDNRSSSSKIFGFY
jgi:hypothetical protein